VDNLKFTEEDKEKFVEFINFVAKHARYPEKDNGGPDTKFCIEYFKHLNFAQTVILKKIDANVFEVKKVVEAKDETPPIPKD